MLTGSTVAAYRSRLQGLTLCAGVAATALGCGVGMVTNDASIGMPRDSARPDATSDAVTSDVPDGGQSQDVATMDAVMPDDVIVVRDVVVTRDVPSPSDVVASDVIRMPPDVSMPPPSCTGSASGTSNIWTCTTDHRSRQRCISGGLQTESCANGCVSQPIGTDDYCAATPPPPGTVSCAYPQWWNTGYSWSPGYYAIRGTYSWDNDLAITAGTPVQLRHASRLVAEGTYAWGWMPEFVDTVTSQRFALLHLQPARRMTTAVGTTYPAGTLVGYSGGNTTDTGYCVAIPGCGTANCALAQCVYSTGAHLCVQTQVSYRTAFPMGTETCR